MKILIKQIVRKKLMIKVSIQKPLQMLANKDQTIQIYEFEMNLSHNSLKLTMALWEEND